MAKSIGKPITLKDIARVTRLSIPAVSLSLLDNPNSTVKISDATREKVRRIAAEMGYRPNLAAQALSKGTTDTVGIITFQTASAQSYLHIRECRPLFSNAGLSSFLYFVEERSREAILQACHAMIDARVSGVLLYLPLEQSQPDTFDALKEFGFPIASVGGPNLQGISRFLADEAEGFSLLTEHLLSEGYRSVGFVTYDGKEGATIAQRTSVALQGFQRALRSAKKKGLKIVSKVHRLNMNFQSLNVPGIDEHYSLGYLGMRRLIELGDLPEALLFQADGKAQGALRACAEAGLRVPQDIAIAGFNDDRSCTAGYVTLTSVALPIREMTRLAAADLIRRIADSSIRANKPVSLPCEVKVRQSTSRHPLPAPLDFDLQPVLR